MSKTKKISADINGAKRASWQKKASEELRDTPLESLTKPTAEGIDIARRTVAKYREAMGIQSSVERRRILKSQI